MENREKRKLPSLEEVLERVNTLEDWTRKPAKTKGAYEDYALHKVAIWGDVDAAEVLLNHGADINVAGEDGDTPLHRAKGNEMVRLLLARGTDPDRKNVFGESCRADLEKLSDPEVVTALRARKR